MLITDKFVMLNFPKTGSAFARDTLKKVHQPSGITAALMRLGLAQPTLQEHLTKPFFFTKEHSASIDRDRSEHGVYMQIPSEHRGKTLMTVVRDPMKRIISLYEFRSWAKYPIPDRTTVTNWFPHFPELDFNEYFDMLMHRSLPYVQPEGLSVAIGPLTTQFIRFYARDPMKTILSLRDGTDLRKEYDLHFPKIQFLHTEDLNRELHQFLVTCGYPSNKIDFILDKQKMNTTVRTRPEYFSSAHISDLVNLERFFYQLFPEYLPDRPA
jgi:hypothetical protein